MSLTRFRTLASKSARAMSVLIRATMTPLNDAGLAPGPAMRLNCTPAPCNNGCRISATSFTFQSAYVVLAGIVGLGVVDLVRQGEGAAGGRHLLQAGLERAQITSRFTSGKIEAYKGLTFCGVSSFSHVKLLLNWVSNADQRRLRARARIALGNRGIVDRGDRFRVAEEEVGRSLNLSADVPHYLVVLQRDLDGLLQGEIPDLPVFAVH